MMLKGLRSMANENLGEISWHCHKDSFTAFIRKDRREKLYIYCNQCGIFGAKGRTFQSHINEHAVMYSAPKAEYDGGGKPAEASKNPEGAEAVAEVIPERKTENFTPAPKESPKKEPQKIGGLMGGLMSILGSE